MHTVAQKKVKKAFEAGGCHIGAKAKHASWKVANGDFQTVDAFLESDNSAGTVRDQRAWDFWIYNVLRKARVADASISVELRAQHVYSQLCLTESYSETRVALSTTAVGAEGVTVSVTAPSRRRRTTPAPAPSVAILRSPRASIWGLNLPPLWRQMQASTMAGGSAPKSGRGGILR